MSRPIGWRSPPKNVLQVQSCTAFDEGGPGRAHVLAGDGGQVGRRHHHRQGADRLDRLDRGGRDHLVARVQRAGVREALLAVHHHRVVEPQTGVVIRQPGGGHAQHHREGGRGDHIRIPGPPGRLGVPAELARLANGIGEVGDLDPADLVRLARAVHPADEAGVQRHAGVTAAGLAGLAVRGVAAAVRAELLQLKTVRVVAPVLLGDVVPVLALLASQRDLGPDIGGSHCGVPFLS